MALWDSDFIARSEHPYDSPFKFLSGDRGDPSISQGITCITCALVGSDSDEMINVDLDINEADPEVRGISTVV